MKFKKDVARIYKTDIRRNLLKEEFELVIGLSFENSTREVCIEFDNYTLKCIINEICNRDSLNALKDVSIMVLFNNNEICGIGGWNGGFYYLPEKRYLSYIYICNHF